MEPLHAIVYVSSAIHKLTEAELDHLLERSRTRNAREDVTGLLLYGDGNFMQYIEGPQPALNAIFASIKRDPLHRDIIELMNEPVAAREFPGWSMACTPAEMEDIVRLSEARWKAVLARDESQRSDLGKELLAEFWRERIR